MKFKYLVLPLSVFILSFLPRFLFFGHSPPSLYWDEVSLGYNAYSIAQTGRDEYGTFFPFWFRAYNEFKLPVYIYFTAGLIKIFGLSDLTIRLPSIIAGSLSPLLFYYIIHNLVLHFRLHSHLKHAPLFAALFFALSPWSIQFSRAAFEANLALFFVLLGTFFYLHPKLKPATSASLSFLSFLVGFFTYNAARIFVPIWLIILLTLIPKYKFSCLKLPLLLIFLPFILTLPSQISQEGQTRLLQTTYFFDRSPKTSLTIFTQNTLSLTGPNFLFFHGDRIGRHSTRRLGMMHFYDLPLVLLGLRVVFKQPRRFVTLIIAWLFLGLLPAAITQPNPHALRSMLMLPPLILLSAFGASVIFSYLRHKTQFFQLLSMSVLFFVIAYYQIAFWEEYLVRYPQNTALDWADGHAQAIALVRHQIDSFDRVYLTTKLPLLHLATYLPLSPPIVQNLPSHHVNTSIQITPKISYYADYEELQSLSGNNLILSPYNPHLLDKPNAQVVSIKNHDPIYVIWTQHDSR